jgi:hypothetical protein
MRLPRFRVQILRSNPGRGRVHLNGRELPGVQSVEVEHSMRTLPRVAVEFNALEAAVEYVDSLDDAEEVPDDAAPE